MVLRDRHQCTAIDDDFSDEAVVSSGVPQGSVLGPLLFSLFVNSLPTLEGVPTVMFADNTTLYVIGHSTTDISAKLSRALTSAHKWLLESGLQLNVTKTKCMLIHSCCWRSLPLLEIQLNGTIIQQVQSYKYIGVVISNTLTLSMAESPRGLDSSVDCLGSYLGKLFAPCTTRTSSLTSPMRMQSGAHPLKHKAEVWNASRTMSPASSCIDA